MENSIKGAISFYFSLGDVFLQVDWIIENKWVGMEIEGGSVGVLEEDLSPFIWVSLGGQLGCVTVFICLNKLLQSYLKHG